MDRRDFFKLSVLTGAVSALESCGSPDHQLIRFIPDEDLVPGIATWKPSVCTLCPAGCGLTVRTMQGDAEVMRNGKLGIVAMSLAKKLEGNPMHPVSQGKLCARGQAGLQVLYNPDRLRNPMKLSGARGSGQYTEISWDDAMKELAGKLSDAHSDAASLAFLSLPLRGQRRELVEKFLKAYGAPAPVSYEPLSDTVLRQANLLSFGHAMLPTIDLGRADYVISFGADFLGTWNSPVAQGVGYGQMRQGRPGRRGKFAQVEPRMSQTGANADEWVPCNPGTEGMLALGIAQVILHEKLVSHDTKTRAGALVDGWAGGLSDYTPDKVSAITGLAAERITGLAHALTDTGLAAAAIVGGAPLAHTNGLFTALAVNALESLLDAGHGDPLVSFTPQPPGAEPAAAGSFAALSAWAQGVAGGQGHATKVLLLGEGNPVFSAPPKSQVREAISKVPYVASFARFLDETSALADLILPDNAPLESWLDDVPESGTTQITVTVAPPAVHPLFNTRATPDVLLDLAHQIGGPVGAALPAKTYDEMLQTAYAGLRTLPGSPKTDSADDYWEKVQDQGGWWVAPSAKAAAPAAGGSHAAMKYAEAQFDGGAGDYPYHFLPYASLSFRDGSLANLPWLQEMPDALTTAMWSSWVELNAKTAEQLRIKTGDMVQVTSSQGSLTAPAIVSPGIAPDVVGMPIGQGHENFGRYASKRGSNPLSILAPVTEAETGSLAWAATRVKLARAGDPEDLKLILYTNGGQSRFPEPEQEKR